MLQAFRTARRRPLLLSTNENGSIRRKPIGPLWIVALLVSGGLMASCGDKKDPGASPGGQSATEDSSLVVEWYDPDT